MSDSQLRSPLDRQFPIPGWFVIAALVMLLVASFGRLFRLDTYLLNVREAQWAYDAFSLFNGRPLPVGQELPESGPFMLVWNAIAFFLFGVTDASARVGSAVLGIGLVGLIFLLRPFLSKLQILGIAGILSVSPTLVFSSRTVEPGIAAAFFAVLVLVTLLRLGIARDDNHGWAILLGVALAALYATGPLGISTLIALSLGILVATLSDFAGKGGGAVGTAIRHIGRDRSLLLWTLGGLVITLLTLFTRAFSSLSSLAGLGTTLSDWVSMMGSGSGNVPAMFSFWSLLLYETLAVVIALATAVLSRHSAMRHESPERSITPLLFVVWFAVALLLNTIASSRDTGGAVLVVVPVLLLAGIGLGRFIEIAQNRGSVHSIAVAAASLLFIAYSVNAMVGLSFTRGESGSEPLAQDVPSMETREFLNQVMRLSRDISVENMTPQDPTGYYGLSILATPEYEWPFTWYFRAFPEFIVAPVGSVTSETDVAIAAHPEVLENAGLTTFGFTWINRPGDPLTMMRSGTILRTGLNPANWGTAWNYMIHRESERHDNPRAITVGYSVRVMNKLTTETGPFNLFDGSSPGPGPGMGQLEVPAGIAVGEDGTIYVLNAGNTRIDRFSQNGEFLGIWSGQVEAPLQLSWNGTQGGTGLHIGPDELIYVADTWNHAVVVVNPNGTVVRVLGNRGTHTDITDGGDPMSEPGLFFGPRDIAVTADRIYVTDTGNERVQVFSMDGTFVTAFGGYGEADGQFIEPTGIAIAPDGTIWVADSGNARLQVFDSEGNLLASHHVDQWEGQVGINRMNLVAFDESGILYFTTPDQGVWAWYEGSTMQVSQSDESIGPQIDAGDSVGIRPGGITVTSDGTLLVTDAGMGEVVRFEPVPLSEFGSQEGTPQATPTSSPVATPGG